MTDTRVYPTLVRSTRGRASVLLAAGTLFALVLTGCSGGAEPKPTDSATATSGASADPTESAAPSSSPTPEATGSAITQTCGDLLTLQDVYDFNPNYGTAPDYSPSAGSLGETAATYNGLTCGWSNQTSGELIEISVVAPNDVLMTTLKHQADADSQAVPSYGTPPAVDGFFTYAGGVGQAQVFTEKYWVTLSTAAFFEPGDAEPLISTVLSHLG
ncbi:MULTISPECIES: iron ABC transporter ATP-binding protein [unclassified Cryobacterium]|uniref:iron ABC transporter ATP-binding protein n=1 Tax=unclassified Cryobacterium TaxID=2649013 RepID=UPI00106CB4C2|nr:MULTISPECIES: iron ABC transporter ATP-binding protein [unclassified Cryobacterium]TFD05611.1 iron ABC transporter ATP-binding protein [Cryobacterium sp. TMT1-66-1]TFD08797.1 iron ABC transporter ATP-binding protein [Cryobacterium sp. TMT1-2-2]